MTDLAMFAGDSQTITVTVLDDGGDPFDLTLWTVAFSAVAGAATITKAGTVALPMTGVATVELDPADTSGLTANVTVFGWSIRITDGTDVYTVDTGELVVTKVPDEAGSSPVATCTLSGTVYRGASGQSGQLVRWRVISDESPVVSGGGYASGDPTVTYTDASGVWSVSLPQSLTVWLEIPAAGVDHYFTVPAASTATLADVTLAEVIR